MEDYVVRPLGFAKVFFAVLLSFALVFSGMMLLLLLAGQWTGWFLSIAVVGFLLLTRYYWKLSRRKLVVNGEGIEVYDRNRLAYTVKWEAYSTAYVINGDWLFRERFLCLADGQVSMLRAMVWAISPGQFRAPKPKSPCVFPIRAGDIPPLCHRMKNRLQIIEEPPLM